jgi:hypothetical protein
LRITRRAAVIRPNMAADQDYYHQVWDFVWSLPCANARNGRVSEVPFGRSQEIPIRSQRVQSGESEPRLSSLSWLSSKSFVPAKTIGFCLIQWFALQCDGYPVRASGPNGEKRTEWQRPLCPMNSIMETGGGSETKPLSQKLIDCGNAHWIC